MSLYKYSLCNIFLNQWCFRVNISRILHEIYSLFTFFYLKFKLNWSPVFYLAIMPRWCENYYVRKGLVLFLVCFQEPRAELVSVGLESKAGRWLSLVRAQWRPWAGHLKRWLWVGELVPLLENSCFLGHVWPSAMLGQGLPWWPTYTMLGLIAMKCTSNIVIVSSMVMVIGLFIPLSRRRAGRVRNAHLEPTTLSCPPRDLWS